ncbi:MAG: DUF1570 domain-containing protein [Planctomycetota bacterium]|nr:MAG: DUF1570 domain-containing protein [Planctomycetota bacterium]REJ95779.1 MAG: DUF1570 domain-containing protein [Planctomycetota bacterium]REK25354.1 MAG: DUF1570 domain-containing protein [Planctomycetota bacterium]REK43489.1 MAG: DUF1570 domain-containing protein [Planctomycetota bacterium]
MSLEERRAIAMRWKRHLVSLVVVVLAVPSISLVWGDTRAGIDPAEVARWPVEKVTLKNGEVRIGLITLENDERVELARLKRERGKAARRVVSAPIARERIADIERLPPAERAVLAERMRRLRTEFREGQVEEVRLTATQLDDREAWRYEGRWFTLVSRANENTTRRAVVRLEQVIAGFRTYLPPRREQARPLRIVILANRAEYQEMLARRGLNVQQTAIFDAQRNEIVAGGRLATFAAELEEIRRHHDNLKRQQRALEDVAERQLVQLVRRLKQEGNSERQVRAVVRAARAQLEKPGDDLRREIKLATARNDAMYQELFRHLYHEAFHSYLENYVFQASDTVVPRWLNEGWAQVFEAGVLDAGMLRVDAPSPERLRRLQLELGETPTLALRELLTSPVDRFVVGHGQSRLESSRLYLYSWGLAYHLTFHRQLLGSEAMDRYLQAAEETDASSQAADAVARFEMLVGTPLEAFEAKWRAAMLAETLRDD